VIKFLYQLLDPIVKWGFKWIYALFFPVYWQQDIEVKNNGYDIISIKKSKNFYFFGTVREWRQF
jgi:hypothetical protein